MPPIKRSHAPEGLTLKIVVIEEIDVNNGAHTVDQFGGLDIIPITVQRAKGAYPAVGEQWVVDRALGRWSFAAVLNPVPIEITGARNTDAVITALLAALETMGLIIDNTTPT